MSIPQQLGPEGLKRKLSSLESEDIAWTTARCNRLLRTIDSRIEAIRNLLRPDIRAPKAVSRPLAKTRRQKPESVTDPVWLPYGSKKPKPRTYGRTKVSRTVRKVEPNCEGKVQAITLPSPFLKRVQNADASLIQRSPAQDHETITSTRPRVRTQLPIKIDDPVKRAECALQSALRTFLSTTHAAETGARRGARGLMGTCLRRIPQYLDSQIGCEDDRADLDEAVTNDVWSFFDDLLDVKGSSWQGLREVVRSQGINAVRCAILDHSLSDVCIEKLIIECESQGALPEIEILFSAWLEAGDLAVDRAKINRLEAMAARKRAQGVQFRLLTRFARRKMSRISALLAASRNLWNILLTAIIQDAQDEALQFLQLCIESHTATKDTDAEDKQLTKNLDEVASKLCTMACTSLLLDNTSIHGGQLREGLSRLALSLLASKHTQVRNVAVSWLHGPVLLTALTDDPPVLIASSIAISQACEEVVRSASCRRVAERRAQDFASYIASDLFSLDTERESDVISSIFTRVKQNIEQSPKTATTRVLRFIATELLTRKRLEHESADDRNVESTIWHLPKTPTAFQTPRAKGLRFGWDDDLCEWVAKTPFTKEVPICNDLNDKENQEPDTPDVLTRTIVKAPCREERHVELASPKQGPQRCTMALRSPQVIIVRAAKRRKSDRIKAKDIEEESEDELAV